MSLGWAFAIKHKNFLNKYKITEVPLKSVDRLFGGKSTFKPIPWIKVVYLELIKKLK